MPRLSRINFPDDFLEKLEQLSVPIRTAESFLEREPSRLLQELKSLGFTVSRAEIDRLRLEVALSCGPKSVLFSLRTQKEKSLMYDTALLLKQCKFQPDVFITTGSQRLDELIGGGLRFHEVIEFVGESSCGKTQLCMTIATIIAGNGGNVLYIDSSNSLSSRRVHEIISKRLHIDDEQKVNEILERITCVGANSVFDAFSIIQNVQTNFYTAREKGEKYYDYKVVILDSVPSLISPILGGEKNFAGHGFMNELGGMLTALAVTCDLAVVVTNNTIRDRDEQGNFTILQPSLGVSWLYVPSVRVAIQRQERQTSCLVCTAELTKHPFKPTGDIQNFSIALEGTIDND